MKVCVVTGGRRGIGKAVVDRFIKEGYYVASCSKNQKAFESYNLLLMKCDVSNIKDVKNFYLKTIKKFKRVDVLVNNAGVAFYKKLNETKIKEIDNMIDVNLKGVIYTTKLFLGKLIESKGTLVNISSVAGLKSYENFSVYCASKYGVVGFSDSLRKELDNVKVYCVCPGPVDTDMWSGFGWIRFPGITKPVTIANKVLDCVNNKYKELIIK